MNNSGNILYWIAFGLLGLVFPGKLYLLQWKGDSIVLDTSSHFGNSIKAKRVSDVTWKTPPIARIFIDSTTNTYIDSVIFDARVQGVELYSSNPNAGYSLVESDGLTNYGGEEYKDTYHIEKVQNSFFNNLDTLTVRIGRYKELVLHLDEAAILCSKGEYPIHNISLHIGDAHSDLNFKAHSVRVESGSPFKVAGDIRFFRTYYIRDSFDLRQANIDHLFLHTLNTEKQSYVGKTKTCLLAIGNYVKAPFLEFTEKPEGLFLIKGFEKDLSNVIKNNKQ